MVEAHGVPERRESCALEQAGGSSSQAAPFLTSVSCEHGSRNVPLVVFPGGPISLSGHIRRHCWQGSDGWLPFLKIALRGHPRFCLWSADNSLLSQSLKSHTFPIHFLISFSSYCDIAKIILPSLFLFLFLYFPSFHVSQVEKKHQCDAARLSWLSSPSDGEAAPGKATHEGMHIHRIKRDVHCAQWVGTVKPRGTWRLLCPNSGQQLGASMWTIIPPWTICFHEVLDIFRAMPPPSTL